MWRIFRMDITEIGDYLKMLLDNRYKKENR